MERPTNEETKAYGNSTFRNNNKDTALAYNETTKISFLYGYLHMILRHLWKFGTYQSNNNVGSVIDIDLKKNKECRNIS